MAPVAPPSKALILQGVVALAGRFPLLAGVDLEVAPGESVVVEGANGAGKTSLLRVVAGLVPVASGRLSVLGFDPVRSRTEVRRRTGLLSHATSLYDDLTVRENVHFAVRAAHGDPARIEEACGLFGLGGRLLRTPAGKLSAGQRRRVALAVIAARRPELWLLDEPHATLDATARSALDGVLAEVAGRGATVIIASHEAGALASLADRVVTMAGGSIAAERHTAVAADQHAECSAELHDGIAAEPHTEGSGEPLDGIAADQDPGVTARGDGSVAHVA